MSNAIERSLLRWIHIVLSFPIAGYIYSRPSDAQQFAGAVRFGFFPAIVLSGLWLWKGHVVRRLMSGKTNGDVQKP